MADTKMSKTLPGITLVRGGRMPTGSIVGRLADPLIAALCLLATTAAVNLPVGRAEVGLAALTFLISYPGSIPFTRQPSGMFRQIAANWGIVVGLLLALGIAFGAIDRFDPNQIALWLVITPMVQAAVHWVLPRTLARVSALQHHNSAIVIGANPLGRTLVRGMTADPLSQTRFAAYFDDRDADRLGVDLEIPLHGKIDAAADFVRANRIDQIYIALPMASQPRILQLLDQLRDTTASIYFLPDIFLYDLIQARVDIVSGMPVVAVCETPFHGTTGLIKRLSDLLIALTAVTLTAPVMLAVAIAIKATMPGPVLFKQRRYGLDGEQIVVWKFRTMKVAEDGDTVRQATRDDDRITALGRFLRRTSLDELPQFFNVLQGRMSVVGPRPHAVAHNEMYRKLIKGYMIRHKVKPGITGWAQVNGARGETDTIEKMQRRIDFDLEYLRNWTLRWDLHIVWLTVLQAMRRDPNVY